MKIKLLSFLFLIPSLSQAYSPVIGEVCTYDLHIMGIRAGSMVTQVEKTEKINEKDVFVLNNTIKTEGMISKFYTLVQKTTSFWKDYSIKHIFSIKENKTEKSGTEEFNVDKKEMIYTKGDQPKNIPLEGPVQDQTSVFYLARSIDWTTKDQESVSVGNYGEIEKVVLSNKGKEKIQGKEAFKIMVEQGKMKNYFWVELAESKNILKLQVDTKGGSLTGTLDSCTVN